ncbi:TetR/AcrR family transcriptional regulator [Methylicorpusculum oleiharenae]|uniref:TetR/AcrR family transcriptional regulator n=1 Tax=Methylicorpusculum oleiharenae TaxID=1338687 RepID=UPI0013577E22|nr:TetR/AcrR family transcriptional regulator [Methylicorpusculum oleiharenae]MCD2453438.1 TetR/AcrR family transcriptional regulator [Methylicorpusculum oleiharenae]
MIKCGRPCKGEELLSRDRVLDSALQLFLEHGYGNLSMETIARDAHVSLRTIYRHFDGKAGLFGALIRRCTDQFIGSLSEDCSMEEALIAFGRQFLFRITRPNVLRIRAILIGESQQFPDLATQFYEQGPSRTLEQLTEFFARHQQAGRIRNIEPDFLADQFISVLRGERLQRLQLGLEAPPEESDIEVWVAKTTSLFLEGCLAR